MVTEKPDPRLAPERQYRVVRLTPDEARYIENRVEGALPSCGCVHLGVFHDSGTTEDGRVWRSCQIWPCGCYEETASKTPAQTEEEEQNEPSVLSVLVVPLLGVFLFAILLYHVL